MNKMLSTVEFERDVAMPVPPIMTRREKLLRFAKVVRESPRHFVIFHKLEYYNPSQLAHAADPNSAFAAAADDPVLRDAGLSGQTAAEAMKFFELSQNELHEFSCDCGGVITNTDMARRIEKLASNTPTGRTAAPARQTLLGRLIG